MERSVHVLRNQIFRIANHPGRHERFSFQKIVTCCGFSESWILTILIPAIFAKLNVKSKLMSGIKKPTSDSLNWGWGRQEKMASNWRGISHWYIHTCREEHAMFASSLTSSILKLSIIIGGEGRWRVWGEDKSWSRNGCVDPYIYVSVKSGFFQSPNYTNVKC